jgi:aryl-alcohol dehydrogenase-like predicted oxidoreductase
MLDKRDLGTSGMSITTVGFGAWAVGGGDWTFGWGPQDDDESIAAIVHAVKMGVNWVDTASVYGLGHSEEVVGRAMARIPAGERPLIFTKCGMAWQEGNRLAPPVRDSAPASLRRDVEASLRRLGVDQIDLFQIHWPDQNGVPVEDSWGEMARFVDEGKVRAIGVSNYGVELLERCERVRHVDSLQPPFSMILRDSGADLIPWCASHGTGVIVYSPMGSGILTDSFSAARVAAMADGDWRRNASRFNEPALSANIALRDSLRPIAERYGTTVSAVAIAWVLSWRGVSAAIVGARRPDQVDGWLGGANLVLGESDLAEIGAAIRRTGAGSGPVSAEA